MTEYEMHFGSSLKLKFTATVEWFAKMDMPEQEHGYYAMLLLNGNEVTRWKLTKLDMMQVFNERPNPHISEDEHRMFRTIDKDGLAEFIARQIGEVLSRDAG